LAAGTRHCARLCEVVGDFSLQPRLVRDEGTARILELLGRRRLTPRGAARCFFQILRTKTSLGPKLGR